jgi:hypothetical protein
LRNTYLSVLALAGALAGCQASAPPRQAPSIEASLPRVHFADPQSQALYGKACADRTLREHRAKAFDANVDRAYPAVLSAGVRRSKMTPWRGTDPLNGVAESTAA